MACGILVPRPGIKPMPPALEAQHLNHWTAREVPQYLVITYSGKESEKVYIQVIYIRIYMYVIYIYIYN